MRCYALYERNKKTYKNKMPNNDHLVAPKKFRVPLSSPHASIFFVGLLVQHEFGRDFQKFKKFTGQATLTYR